MAYERGQEVFRSKPFCHMMEFSYRTKICDFCLKFNSEANTKCLDCSFVHYCNKLCQKLAWASYHQQECKYFKKLPCENKTMSSTTIAIDYDDIVTYTYFLIRVILKLNNGGDKEFEQLPNGQKRYFKDLISHRNEIQQDENKMFIFMGIYSYLQVCLDESELLLNLPKNDVLEIFGKVFINSIGIERAEECSRVGIGLYLGLSVLDHSCRPNVVGNYNPNDYREIIIRTIGKIKHFSDIRLSYITGNLYENTEKRRKLLMETYYFYCECSNCLDESADFLKSSLKCPHCEKGCVPILTECCVNCNKNINHQKNPELIQASKKIRLKISNAISNLTQNNGNNYTCSDINIYENLYDQAVEVLHPYDCDFMALLEKLSEIFFQVNARYDHMILRKYLNITKLMDQNLSLTYPKFHPYLGTYCLCLAKISYNLHLYDEAKSYNNRLEKILQVAYGPGHPELEKCKRFHEEINFMILSI